MVSLKWFGSRGCRVEEASKNSTESHNKSGQTFGVPYSDNVDEVTLFVEDTQVRTVNASLVRQFTLLDLQLNEAMEKGEAKTLRLLDSEQEVQAMLSVLHISEHDQKATRKLTIDTLISTLAMASKYENLALRERMVQILDFRQSEIPPAKRIELARTCSIPSWTRNAVHELGTRKDPITSDEEAMIGPDMMVPISRQRERTCGMHTLRNRIIAVVVSLNTLVVPLNFLAYELDIDSNVRLIAVMVVSILCNIIPFALILPLFAVFGRAGAANRRSAALQVICILLVVLPGFLMLREPIVMFLRILITEVLWPADLYFISPCTGLIFMCLVLLEMGYFYGPGNIADRVSNLMTDIKHREPAFVPWPSQCPACSYKVGECQDKDCERCLGGRTLYN